MKLTTKTTLLSGLLGLLARQGITPFGFPTVKRGSRSYPEQSSRQAVRKYRRAHGGPGIVLVNGEYVPRTV